MGGTRAEPKATVLSAAESPGSTDNLVEASCSLVALLHRKQQRTGDTRGAPFICGPLQPGLRTTMAWEQGPLQGVAHGRKYFYTDTFKRIVPTWHF